MKRLLLILLCFLTFHLQAADYYWVGGGGDWSDLNHWHLGSSAGPTPSIVPSSGDNVFFDANSGFGTTAAARTVTLDANGFCNNMTWESGVPNNPIFVTANANIFSVEVWGNMILSPITTYTCMFRLKGATPATITSNGTVLGAFGIEIDKPGSSLTVTDSLIVPYGSNVPTAFIVLTSGTFDISGKNVSHLRFSSNNNNARTLEMTNSTVTFTYYYAYLGANKTLNASGSTLNALGWLYMDGGSYNIVTNIAVAAENHVVNNTMFNKLVFTSLNASSEANMDGNNTVDSLIFMSRGAIGNSNNVNVIVSGGTLSLGSSNIIDSISAVGSVNMGNTNTVNRITGGAGSGGMGVGNTVTYWQHGGHFTVTGTGTNNIDSLLLAPGKIIKFSGTFNVNKYLQLNGVPCDAFSEVSGDSLAGSLNFAAGAVAVMNNMTLIGLKAFGPITPLTVAAIDNGGNQGFNITPPTSGSTTLYWIGGSGDWNDRNHWSNSSGGAGGACVPFINDDVVFDGNSGLSTTGTLTTSSSSFCKNMTWSNVGNITFNESSASAFRIYGSLVMDSTVTMNSILEFYGSDSTTTITTNGSTLGTLQFLIRKSGNGRVTLMDNWSNTAGSIFHTSGGLKMEGRTVSISYYWSNTGQARFLDITNATINVANRWEYSNGNKTMTAAGSHITCPLIFVSNVPAVYYPWVDLGYAGTGSAFNISGTQFGQLTFTATGTTSNANIDGGNTIRRLEFKGRGVITVGGNTIDTLILANSRNYFFTGTNTITKYLQAQSTPCAGLSEIKGNPTGTLAFSAGAVANMSSIYMQNMIATGPITPIAFNGADAGGNTGWTITSTAGAPRYWIGGSGDWNENTHWSATSGGAGGACIPTVFDDVYFDANSGFTTVSKTVTINNGNAYCRNVNWTGAANSPIWSKSGSWNLEAWGDSVVVIPAATFNVSLLTVKGSNTTYLQGSAPLGNFDISIDKPGGGLTLLNNYSNTNTDFHLQNGAFNVSGKTLNVGSITNLDLVNTSSMDISNASINISGWRYSNIATNHTLNAANSVINTGTFAGTGLTYNKVNISGTAGAHAQFAGTTIDSLIFTNTSTASVVGLNGANNTLNYVEYKGSGNVYSTGNTINTLVFFPGKIYTFTAGTTTNITNEWFASGTPCSLTEIVSSSTTANATINKTGGAPEFDYVRVRRITATGSTPFVALNHTIDQGNNTNWSIAPYNGAAPIYGLGPDTAIAAGAFPYTLYTDGFFGNPSSQYLWNNGSTADSLVVTDTGTYSVNVNFVDGCNINDNIHITLAVPLPVTLASFSAAVQNCQANLNWKVTDAVNFSHFAIEKSRDGRSFENIGEVSYANGVYEYNHTDRSMEKGTSYYRLKLIDNDGKFFYSTIESVQSGCELQSIKVYPTLTKGEVYIDLPSRYKQAQIEVYNAFGQLLQLPDTDKVSHNKMHSIQLQGLAQGQYLLKVINGNEVNTFKVIYQP